jgi:hypothetical protein
MRQGRRRRWLGCFAGFFAKQRTEKFTKHNPLPFWSADARTRARKEPPFPEKHERRGGPDGYIVRVTHTLRVSYAAVNHNRNVVAIRDNLALVSTAAYEAKADFGKEKSWQSVKRAIEWRASTETESGNGARHRAHQSGRATGAMAEPGTRAGGNQPRGEGRYQRRVGLSSGNLLQGS